jgi:hypothetical protein
VASFAAVSIILSVQREFLEVDFVSPLLVPFWNFSLQQRARTKGVRRQEPLPVAVVLPEFRFGKILESQLQTHDSCVVSSRIAEEDLPVDEFLFTSRQKDARARVCEQSKIRNEKKNHHHHHSKRKSV